MGRWISCEVCDGSGVIEHDCGEDVCCCEDSDDNICISCNGKGGRDEATQ